MGDRNIFQHVDNMMNHEQNNLNNNVRNIPLNDIDQTVISDCVNPDGVNVTDNEINGLSKELNNVMNNIKEKNKIYGSVKIPTSNADTTIFYRKVNNKNNNNNLIINNAVHKKKIKDKRNVQTNEQGEAIFQISYRKRVTVRKWQGSVLVDIRHYYQKKDLPSKKGISLTLDQYQQLRKHIID